MDLLGRARGFLKGLSTPPAARVQYYNVICPEGHRIRGQRTEGYQALRCPSCGEGVFVLPSSPLPEPEAPPKKAPRRAAAQRPIDDAPLVLKDPEEVTVDVADRLDRQRDAEIDWEEDPISAEPSQEVPDDEPEVDRPSTAAREPQPRTEPGRARPSKQPLEVRAETGQPTRRRASRKEAYERPPEAIPIEALSTSPRGNGQRGRRIGRPIVIVVGLLLLVAGSIALRSWRSRWHQLPEVAAIGRTEGIPALEEGKFDKAYQLLAGARDAVDALGGNVEGAEEIRHAADEASIFVDLLSDSLETLLEEAARTRPQEWATRFDNLYKGRSVIIQAMIIATPGSAGSSKYELDYVVLPPGEGNGEQRLAKLDISDLEAITLARPKEGNHVTFGARLASFQYDTERESFVIRFEPKSGVAIRYSKALEVLGWPR